MKNKLFFSIGFLWEIIHISFFIWPALFIQAEIPLNASRMTPFILLLGTGQLLIPAGYLFLLFDNNKFGSMIQLLRLGKILQLIMMILLFVREYIEYYYIIHMGFEYMLYRTLMVPLAIFLIFDLIFLYFLLSYKVADSKNISAAGENHEFLVAEEIKNVRKEGADNENPSDSQW